MALLAWVEQILLSQRGALYPWAPVCFGAGIGGYFASPEEPLIWVLWAAGLFGLTCSAVLVQWRSLLSPLLWAICLVSLGFALAGYKAHRVAGPKIDWRYYGPIEGRIIYMDRSASGAVRLTLDQVVLERVSPRNVPKRVRVALHGPYEAEPKAGSTVMITGHLSAPSGPVEPGGFDFQRHAWFMKLGAVGYSRQPLMLLEPASAGALISQARYGFADWVRERLPGERGAFAATIMAGDRSAMSQETVDNLRHTNLAHLLAISGLHMGLLSGFVFAAVRYGLLLVPWLRHKIPIRKTAAVIALIVSFLYLLLSGGSVATERAFVMATVALGAVFFERRVFSLRSVATAALIVMALRPEALLGPGFQMSFAATTALVATFAAMRDYGISLGPKWLKPVSALFVTSLVAGLATAPIAAAHFNHWAHYGLLVNLAAVPLMGAVVMPAGVIALLLWPIGLSDLGFYVMQLGIGWILGVADFFASLEGARGTVVAPEPSVLLLLVLGALLAMLWRGPVRLVGAAPIAASLLFWVQTERPDVLISDNGKLVGIMGEAGRALSAERGSGFVASGWLENDGDVRAQVQAAKLWSVALANAPVPIIHAKSKRQAEAAQCNKGEILVLGHTADAEFPCLLFDPASLRDTGSVALYFREGALEMKTAREVTGRRLWNTPQR